MQTAHFLPPKAHPFLPVHGGLPPGSLWAQIRCWCVQESGFSRTQWEGSFTPAAWSSSPGGVVSGGFQSVSAHFQGRTHRLMCR